MDDKLLDFSIIIPTFNNIELFKIAIHSVKTQQKIKFEIIIVDDSTNNNIEMYISEINFSTLKYIHNIPTLGAVKNWNSGLKMAQGKYLILLHHDEYFIDDINLLQNCLAHFQKTNHEAIILNSRVNFRDGRSKKNNIPNFIKNLIIKKTPSLLYSVNIIGPTSCVIFKRNICVPFNEELKWLVDIDWYYRLLKGKKIQIDKNHHIASFHGHENQITQAINIKATEIKDQFVIREHFGKYSSVSVALFIRNCLYFVKNNLRIKNNPFWKEK